MKQMEMGLVLLLLISTPSFLMHTLTNLSSSPLPRLQWSSFLTHTTSFGKPWRLKATNHLDMESRRRMWYSELVTGSRLYTAKPLCSGTNQEASRLVFVALRDSLPRRKVAVPVPEGFTWKQFTEQVKAKLKLDGVAAIYLASSGEKISSLDGLEDIDELLVEEGSPAAAPQVNGVIRPPINSEASLRTGGEVSSSEAQYAGLAQHSTFQRQQSTDNRNHQVTIDDDAMDVDGEEKYVKRSNFVKRMAQRIFPDAFSPSLPVATRGSGGHDEKEGRIHGTKRRRHRGKLSRSTIVLIMGMLGSAVTMFVLYWALFPSSS